MTPPVSPNFATVAVPPNAATVAVLGAGMAGLTAAHTLAESGHHVIVVERSDRIGGHVRTEQIDGVGVDVGAESVHLGAPHVAALVRHLGLADSAVGAAPGSSLLMTRRGLVPLPAGVGPTGPTKLMPVLKSGILSVPGLVRAGLEPALARRKVDGDVSVGAFLRARYGNRVTDQFVDPLLGNLHGGDIDQLSLHATAPQLRGPASAGTSLTFRKKPKTAPKAKSKGTPPPSAPPMFASWPQGLSALPEALAANVEVRTGQEVLGLERVGAGWRISTDDDSFDADAIVMAIPARAAAELLLGLDLSGAAEIVAQVPNASVATIVLGYPKGAAKANEALSGANGILLPSVHVKTLKAATFLSRKWPHLAASEHYLVRASVGRYGVSLSNDDEELVRGASADLAALIGLSAQPALSHVVRWDNAMPQLTVGHLERIMRLRRQLEGYPTLALAGGPIDGLGIGSVVKSGQAAAAAIIAAL